MTVVAQVIFAERAEDAPVCCRVKDIGLVLKAVSDTTHDRRTGVRSRDAFADLPANHSYSKAACYSESRIL